MTATERVYVVELNGRKLVAKYYQNHDETKVYEYDGEKYKFNIDTAHPIAIERVNEVYKVAVDTFKPYMGRYIRLVALSHNHAAITEYKEGLDIGTPSAFVLTEYRKFFFTQKRFMKDILRQLDEKIAQSKPFSL